MTPDRLGEDGAIAQSAESATFCGRNWSRRVANGRVRKPKHKDITENNSTGNSQKSAEMTKDLLFPILLFDSLFFALPF